MADVADLTLTPDEMDTARAALRDAWRRRGVADRDMPEAVRMSEQAMTFAERQHSGLLVALWLDAETAQQLAVDGGEPADSLHLTLCYAPPDSAGWDDLRQARVIAAVEREAFSQSVRGRIGGYGRFIATESSDGKDVFYAAVDAPGLESFRSGIVAALHEAGVLPSTTHGYTPHITLAYLDTGAANPVDTLPALDLRFDAVTVMFGDERRVDIPLAADQTALFAIRDDTDRHDIHVYTAVQFAEPPEWSPFLPVPGVYEHPVYGRLDYTAETYDRILDNFRTGVYQERLPINAEHDPYAAGAVGWIVDMRLAESGAIEVKTEWNERGKALIEGDRYKYVSAELMPEWVDPVDPDKRFTDVAVGMAITTHPYFKERVLPPLAASEAVLTRHAGIPGKEARMSDQNAQHKTPPADQSEAATNDAATDAATDEANRSTVQMNEQMLAEFRQLKADRDKVKQELAEVQARNAELHDKALVKEFTDEVRGRSDQNHVPWVGDIKGHVEMLTDLAKAFGEESEQVKRYIATNRAQAEQSATADLFREFGTSRSGDNTGQARIDAATDEAMKANPNLSREQAEAQVLSERPDLYAQYLRERR